MPKDKDTPQQTQKRVGHSDDTSELILKVDDQSSMDISSEKERNQLSAMIQQRKNQIEKLKEQKSNLNIHRPSVILTRSMQGEKRDSTPLVNDSLIQVEIENQIDG